MIIIIPIAITAVLLFLLFSPVDLIPDVIPILGWTDDFIYFWGIAIVWFVYLTGSTTEVIFDLVKASPTVAIAAAGSILIILSIARRNQ